MTDSRHPAGSYSLISDIDPGWLISTCFGHSLQFGFDWFRLRLINVVEEIGSVKATRCIDDDSEESKIEK